MTVLKKSAKERRRFIRDAADLVRGLAIELEIQLGLGPSVFPILKRLELAPTQAPFRKRSAPDGDADPRCLPGDAAFLWNRFGRGDHAARDETRPALVLAGEDEDRVAFGDVLAAVHRLLRSKRERPRPRIDHLPFAHKRGTFP